MVSTTKSIVSRSAYEAPVCKLYSIHIEGVIATSDPDGSWDGSLPGGTSWGDGEGGGMD